MVVVVAAAAGVTACSALLDWSGFSGGGNDAEAGGSSDGPIAEAGPDVPVVPCDAGTCTPAVPSGWTGPVALYVGLSDGGASPACPPGFDATPVFDGTGSLVANPAQCTTCTCGAATGVTCADPVLTVYVDPGCNQSLGSPMSVDTTCAPTTPFGFAATVAAPQPMGGSCTASGSTPTIPPPAWGTVGRACAASSPGACSSGGSCAPAPPSPFSPRTCIMASGSPPCPAGWTFGPQVLYTGVSDARGCSPCSCAAPTGGQCTIASPAIGVYSNLGCSSLSSTLDAPSACAALTGPDPVQLLAAPVLSVPGNCAASGGSSVGMATPTGATSFCCTP